jgi:glucokinase
MASTSALLRYFVDAGGEPGTGLDGRQLSVLLKNGHPAAIKAFSRMSRYLALGVSDICSAIAPHRIIFSGGLVEGIGYGLLQALHDSLVSFSYPRIQRQVDLVCGILGDDAGAIGATLVQTNDSP